VPVGRTRVGVAVAVPDPWGAELEGWRASFGDPQAGSIPAHITLLPPTAVSDDDLQALRDEDERRTAYESALRLLSYRPRSEKEIRTRLARRGIQPAIIEETAERLRQLHYLLPHYIKLTPVYTNELTQNQDSRFIVSSLIRIAQPLEIRIIAQAVESEALILLLEEMGFSGYQGYASGRPVPIG